MKNWPRYVKFKNNTIMVFDKDVPKNFLVRGMKDQITNYGVVDVNKWECYEVKDGDLFVDNESTMIMRLTLSV